MMRSWGPLRKKMASTAKPEVHGVSQRRQRKTEPRSQATCTQKFGEVRPVVFELCQRTEVLIIIFDTAPGSEVNLMLMTLHVCASFRKIIQLLKTFYLSVFYCSFYLVLFYMCSWLNRHSDSNSIREL